MDARSPDPQGRGVVGGERAGPFRESSDDEDARARYAARLSRHHDLPSVARLTTLASQLTGSTSAQVSLISDVQTVVATAGAASAALGEQTPAEDSLCSVTVRSESPVVVVDARRDERVSHLAPVTSGAVGSYLGVPLVAGSEVVGALCVFDESSRTWTPRDVELLTALAAPVVAELELAALETAHEADRLVWQLAVDAGGVGAFDWDLVTGELRWDERLLQLFGIDRATFGGTIDAFNAIVHPDDRDRVTHALETAIASVGEYEAEYRIVLPDGRIRWIAARGQALADATGHAVKVVGAASDTTGGRDAEAQVRRILEAMPSAFFQLDSQWRFSYANPEAITLLGAVSTHLLGENIWELFPHAVGTLFETSYRGAVHSGEPVLFEAYYPEPLDSWFEVRAWPGPDGLSVYFLDISDRRQAQAVLSRSARRSALTSDVAAAMSETYEQDDAAERLARLLVRDLADWCVVTLATGEGSHTSPPGPVRGLRVASWAHADPDRVDLALYAGSLTPTVVDGSFVARAVTTAGTVVIADDVARRMTQTTAPVAARELLTDLDPWSGVFVPLTSHGRVVGVMSLFRGRERPAFDGDTVSLLEDVAGRAGLALDNARLYREQRDLATALQQSMLTAPPEPDHLQIVARYVPAAEAAQVGGDWYDAFMQRDGATVVVIGDVIGHDTAAAATMGQLRSVLRGIAVTTGASPQEVLRRVDEAMELLMLRTSATAIVSRFEQTPGEREEGTTRLRWSNAGHPPPLVVTDGDAATHPSARASSVLWTDRPNMLLGIQHDVERDETCVTLRRGTTVVLYTDGLIERRGQDLDTGIDLLGAALDELVADQLPLDELCDELLARLLPAHPEDDVALIAVRLHPEEGPRPVAAGPHRTPDRFVPT